MALLLFDLNGTLLDPGERRDALREAIRLSTAHTLAGDPRPLAELLEAAGSSPPREMAPYPDVAEGLDALSAAGHRLVVATNSAGEQAEALLERAGLRDRFEQVIGADALGVPKPARRAYEAALERAGGGDDVRDGDRWLVAAHDWDLIGAHGAGLRTAFLDRGGPEPVTIEVDRSVAALTELRI